ncbi:MAG: PadR family transcriptional regulator [Terriglobia bacterium]
MKAPRISRETHQVLESFFERVTDWRYGYELSRETGLKSGTLYPILMRLEKHKLLEARWVTAGEGVPPRHTYRLTPNGLELARSRIRGMAKANNKRLLRKPALSGG